MSARIVYVNLKLVPTLRYNIFMHPWSTVRCFVVDSDFFCDALIFFGRSIEDFEAVSYTHLDVYKRQHQGRVFLLILRVPMISGISYIYFMYYLLNWCYTNAISFHYREINFVHFNFISYVVYFVIFLILK